MQAPFHFNLSGLDFQPRATTYQIRGPPVKYEAEPMIMFSTSISTSQYSHSRTTSVHHRHKSNDIDPLTTLPPTNVPKYVWGNIPPPPNSIPEPPTKSTTETPHRPLTDYEIADQLSHWLKDKNFHRHSILAEQQNSFRGMDMNDAWNRARINAHTHNAASEQAYPVLDGGAAIKKDVMEIFMGFSFMLQHENLQFDEETLKSEGFGFVFKGDGDATHGDGCGGACYKRKPGAWWGTRKKLLECCRGVRFIDDVERQSKKIMDNVMKWHADGRGGSKILGVHDLRGSATTYMIDARYSKSIPSVHLRCDKGSRCGWFKWKSGAGDDSGDHAIKRTCAARNLFQDQYNWKHSRIRRIGVSEQVMSEEWRARRREQEKKAGRWTDGTLLMDPMWAEFYWCTDGIDDPRDGPFISRKAVQKVNKGKARER